MWSINIGSRKSLLLKAVGQIAQINLVACENRELMAESQYPQTTSKNKTATCYHIIIVFFSVDKDHHIHRRWVNLFPTTPRFSYSEKRITC